MNLLRKVIHSKEMGDHMRQRKIILTSERVESTSTKLDHRCSDFSTYSTEVIFDHTDNIGSIGMQLVTFRTFSTCYERFCLDINLDVGVFSLEGILGY